MLISTLEKLDWFHLTGLITLVLNGVKMDGCILNENSSVKMLEVTFSSKLDWSSYVISIAKTVSRKMES